jgi:hypothetical protein
VASVHWQLGRTQPSGNAGFDVVDMAVIDWRANLRDPVDAQSSELMRSETVAGIGSPVRLKAGSSLASSRTLSTNELRNVPSVLSPRLAAGR